MSEWVASPFGFGFFKYYSFRVASIINPVPKNERKVYLRFSHKEALAIARRGNQ